MKTIIFSAGGTLGHINPALWIIQKYREKHPNDRIIFIASQKDREKALFKQVTIDKVFYLNITGFNYKKPYRLVKTMLKIPKINQQIKKIFSEYRPNVVVGMGGYVSGLVIKQAIKMKIKTIIHEQNSRIGLSNQLVYRKVTHALASFPLNKKRFEVIGNPRYDEVIERKKSFGVIGIKKTICLIGGSLGSAFINQLAIDMIEHPEALKYRFVIVTGPKYYQKVLEKTKDCKVDLSVVALTTEPLKLFNESSVVITRSGATTLFELRALGKPSILIPSPNVTKNHQYYNALAAVKWKMAVVIKEKEVDVNKIYQVVIPKLLSSKFSQESSEIMTPTDTFIRLLENE